MRSTLLTLLGLFAFCFTAQASHITGGDIQYRYIGDSTGIAHHYEITLRVYRDCGPTASTFISGNVTVKSSCYPNQSQTLPQIMGPLANGEFEPPTYEDCVNPGSVKCLGIRLFRGYVTLPGLCSDYTFYYSDCCRPPGVDNLAQQQAGFYFEAKLNNNLGNNSSAKFVSEPARAFCVGQNFNWNQAVIELDGDSLRYNLIDARQNITGTSIGYANGYSAQYPISTTPVQSFTINPTTGNMNFTPSQTETVVIALEVEEYRFDSTFVQWIKIGSSNRELVASVAGTCSAIAQAGVKLNYNAPGYYPDPVNGLPTVDYTCLDSSVVLKFATKLDCSTISPDGTDFRLTAPNGQPIPVKSLEAICDVNNEATELTVNLHKPLAINGKYFLYSKMGNDGTTLLNKCGFPMDEFDTIQLNVQGCFETKIDLKNVTIVDDQFPQIQWLLDTTGNYPTQLVDEYKIKRSDDGGNTYNLIYSIKNYKSMIFNDQSVSPADVDAQSYKYKVEVIVTNISAAETRDVHSILLGTDNGQPIVAPADNINLKWNDYNGWPNPEYTVTLGTKDLGTGAYTDVAHVPQGGQQNPTDKVDYNMQNTNLQPGDYRVCVRADYPGGSGPYQSWSNCLEFRIYEPPIPPIDTPTTVKIPNVLTPNGDNNNDLLKIENIETWSSTRSVKIFNRWGGVVFETESYDNANAWNGEDRNGSKVADGVYFYIVELYDQPSGKRDNLNGEITIMGSGI